MHQRILAIIQIYEFHWGQHRAYGSADCVDNGLI